MVNMGVSQMALIVKNPPLQERYEAQVQFLGWENPLEKAWQPTPVSLPGESSGQRSQQATVQGVTKSQTLLKQRSTHSHIFNMLLSGRLIVDCYWLNFAKFKHVIPMDTGAWWATVHGVTELNMTEWLSTAQSIFTETFLNWLWLQP